MAIGCCMSAPAVDSVDEPQLQRLLLEAPLQAGQVKELHQRRVCCVRCCEVADGRLYSCIRCRLKCPDRFTRSVPRAFKLESRVGVLLPLKHPNPNNRSIKYWWPPCGLHGDVHKRLALPERETHSLN